MLPNPRCILTPDCMNINCHYGPYVSYMERQKLIYFIE